MGLPTPFNPNSPIPNNPFYAPQFSTVNSSIGPLILGAGLNISATGNPPTLSTSGGGGGGSVSQIIAGTGISVSPSGGTGNVIVNNTGVLSLVAGTGISVSAAFGIYTINATGGTGTVTSVLSGSGLTGGPITTTGTLALDYACVVDPTDFTAKGSILAGTGPGTYSALAVGANGLVLTACSTAANGLCWASASANDIPCSAITAKGALITGTGPSTLFSLGVGANGQVLTACSACGPGMYWTTPTATVPSATPSVEGIVYGVTDAATTFNVGLGSGVLSAGPATGPGNVAIGTQAGYDVTSGQQNNFVGAGAGCALTTGNANNFLGFLAGAAVTTGSQNVLLGNSAGSSYTTEQGNVIIGGNAGVAGCCNQILLSDGIGTLRLQLNECGAISPDGATYGTTGQVLCSGGPNSTWGWTSTSTSEATSVAAGIIKGCTNNTLCSTFLGCCAGPSIPPATGLCNTALGYQAGASLTTGGLNTLVGVQAGDSINSGCWNILVGHSTGQSITAGGCNIAIGGAAGSSITTTSENVLIGDLAGTALTGTQNVGVGTRALCAVGASTGSTALGNYAGSRITSGACNIAIGWCAMASSTSTITGNSNVAVGAGGFTNLTSGAANISVGSANFSSLTTGGCNISIGSSNNVPAATTCLTTTIGNGLTPIQSCSVRIGWAFGDTTATFISGSASWNVSSDARSKDNIEDFPEGLDLIEKLQPRSYDWVGGREEGEPGVPSFGLIAQEVAEAIAGTGAEGRGLVLGSEEDGYGVSYAQLVVPLINAVKELSARVKELEAK